MRLSKNRTKFMRLAEKRVNKVAKQLLLIGNLSNKTNYAYSVEEVDQMFEYIKECTATARKRFQANTSSPKTVFTLNQPRV